VKEDKLTEAIISAAKHDDIFDGEDVVYVEPEAHYSFYGKRGVADLYIRRAYPPQTEASEKGIERSFHGSVFEVKSSLKNANEVLRQFNRMVHAFFRDEDRESVTSAHYELTIVPSKANLKHLIEFRHIYSTIYRRNHDTEGFLNVGMRHPNNLDLVELETMFDQIDQGRLHEFLKSKNSSVYEQIEID
jgi:hypothetical protein